MCWYECVYKCLYSCVFIQDTPPPHPHKKSHHKGHTFIIVDMTGPVQLAEEYSLLRELDQECYFWADVSVLWFLTLQGLRKSDTIIHVCIHILFTSLLNNNGLLGTYTGAGQVRYLVMDNWTQTTFQQEQKRPFYFLVNVIPAGADRISWRGNERGFGVCG